MIDSYRDYLTAVHSPVAEHSSPPSARNSMPLEDGLCYSVGNLYIKNGKLYKTCFVCGMNILRVISIEGHLAGGSGTTYYDVSVTCDHCRTTYSMQITLAIESMRLMENMLQHEVHTIWRNPVGSFRVDRDNDDAGYENIAYGSNPHS